MGLGKGNGYGMSLGMQCNRGAFPFTTASQGVSGLFSQIDLRASCVLPIHLQFLFPSQIHEFHSRQERIRPRAEKPTQLILFVRQESSEDTSTGGSLSLVSA